MRTVMTIALLLLFLVALLLGCWGGDARLFPIQVHLSFSEPPLLEKPVEVTAIFNLLKDHYREVEHDVTASIVLSEGFELVNGSLEWKGDFVRGQTYSITATIKAVKTGTWAIGAQALFSPGEGATDGGATALYVTVTENSATISDRPPHEIPTPEQTNPPES